MNERETRIREWAYRLWEEEGYPHGRDGEHWFRAVAIVMEEDGLPEAEAAADTTPATESEAAPETASEPEPAPVAAAKPKAARPKKVSAESTITEAPAPASVSPGRRKRT
ncbi:DUF2934 domain-containing protein [Ancylobacter rudongensis]|uniref:DUF2934 domain-containing protein n=1 Tax=Ancylobacter rudongensis TaxID=177413 RepID=A0A1G4TJJ2_9HYPH|nr:DUF2934 domain-containing protein [Ancylobacter rudongensis]SCW80995.1 Protein of unknown function [Ancylobacter rudongensis]